MTRKFLPALLGLALVLAVELPATAQSLVGYSQADSRSVVFYTDSAAALRLTLCSPTVIKLEYAFDGSFAAGPPTPAVINEDLEKASARVSEAASLYEIFTGALRISLDKSPVRLRIYDPYQKMLCCDEQWSRDGDEISCRRTMARDEQIFGLGEKSGIMNRRGGVFTMWNSDKPCYCTDEDPLYKSIPFFISSKRYGIFFDNSYKSTFDFSGRNSYTFSAEGGDMIYYIITGEDYKDILGKYIALTGKPVMPPRWALGFSQCRGNYTREDLALEVARGFRSRRIPCDVIYQDIGWTRYLQDFEWNPRGYTDPWGMLDTLKAAGFHMVVSQDPVISQKNARQWAEADSLGLLVKDVRSGDAYDMPWPWGGNCGVVDFTNPDAAAWWGGWQQKPLDCGVDGFWTDMGEPAWSNLEDSDRLFMEHFAGPHAKIHNVYGLYWDRIVAEEFYRRNPGKRLFQMTRACFSGMQRYTFSWTGDSGSGRKMTDSWEQLAYQIPMMLSAGLGGIPFITGDITGYCGAIDDYRDAAELYVRWLQFGLFTPLSRAHHEGGTAVEPWMFTEEAEALARKAIELKYSLMPYIYNIAREAFDTGLPLMRAMFLEFPSDRECLVCDGQFMFGPDLLVVPVTEPGVRSVDVYLPKGKWYDWYTGDVYTGGRHLDFPVTLDHIPLFARAGSIVPTMEPQQYLFENPSYDIIARVFPLEGRTASCLLYDDDGLSPDYQQGIFSTREISCTCLEGCFSLEVGPRQAFGGYESPWTHNILITIPCSSAPKQVLLGGKKMRGAWKRREGVIKLTVAG